jgi:hypothetical protein
MGNRNHSCWRFTGIALAAFVVASPTTGEYLSSIACRSCPQDPESVFTLTAKPDGTLSLWGQRWIPTARDLFIRDDGKRLLGFARDAEGRVSAVSAGSWRVADRIR